MSTTPSHRHRQSPILVNIFGIDIRQPDFCVYGDIHQSVRFTRVVLLDFNVPPQRPMMNRPSPSSAWPRCRSHSAMKECHNNRENMRDSKCQYVHSVIEAKIYNRPSIVSSSGYLGIRAQDQSPPSSPPACQSNLSSLILGCI